jgi:hypothetical protein
MNQPQPTAEPITNQEIQAAGQRIAANLIAHLLTEARDYLGTDTIGEAITDDPDHHRLDAHTRGLVWREVWDHLGHAAHLTRYRTAWRSARTRARHTHDENTTWRRTVTHVEQARDRAFEDARTLDTENKQLADRVRELEAALAAARALTDPGTASNPCAHHAHICPYDIDTALDARVIFSGPTQPA